MRRRLVIVIVLLALLAGGGYVSYRHFTRGTPPPESPVFNDIGDPLPTQEQFDQMAETEPVKLFAACLTRYQREYRDGMRCVVEKQERIGGKAELDPVEKIELRVRGDVPEPGTNKTAIEVLILWKQGAKKPNLPLAAPIEGTLFSELPPPHGYGGKAVPWQPGARFGSAVREPMDVNSKAAQEQSRYCVRDAGIYRSMLRSYEVWKKRKQDGVFDYEYMGTQKVERAGNVECHVLRRVCAGAELDAFELNGAAPTDPAVIATQGFTEVTLYIDRTRWIQVGTEQHRTGPNGTKVLVASYFFRDVELNPKFGPDDFTTKALKK